MTALPIGAYCAFVEQVAATRWPTGCSLIVLTGGASRRLGRDKATIHVGGRRLVDRLLADVPAEVPVIVVGPTLEGLSRRVTFVREDPPGSGPLAGIGAGVAAVGTPYVGVIAADMPFALPVVLEALTRLLATTSVTPGSAPVRDRGHSMDQIADAATGREVGAVVPVDPGGYRQLLCAAYRADILRGALDALGPLAGQPVRAVAAALDVMEWPVPPAALADVDTQEQLAGARTRAAEEDSDMQEWVDAVRAALGVDVALDIDAILDVARDAAHGVDRPAAPVTTYLLGAAVAGGVEPAHAAAVIGELARGWAARDQ
jgi:molybdopterin-guanine dinucleotide biosynthesis protein A